MTLAALNLLRECYPACFAWTHREFAGCRRLLPRLMEDRNG